MSESQHFVEQRGQLGWTCLNHSVGHRLKGALEDREEGLQLVRDVLDDGPSKRFLACQGVGHTVEGHGQFPDLGRAAAVAYPCAAVAALYRPDSAGEGDERTGDPPRYYDGDGEGEDCCQSGGRRDRPKKSVAEVPLRRWQPCVGESELGDAHDPARYDDRLATSGAMTTRDIIGATPHGAPSSVEQDDRRFTLLGYGERRARSAPCQPPAAV